MTSQITISDLTKVVKESGLPEGKAAALEAAFMPFYEQVAKHCETAFQIKVTNIAQTAEMGRAKKIRLELQQIRIATEKAREQEKEAALREGQAIDKIAKFLQSVIKPMEAHLLNQEKYGERLREQFQAEERERNLMEAGKYLEFFPDGLDLGTVGEENFKRHLDNAKTLWNAREAENARIESERIEREHKEAQEREAMRVENEKLRAEAEEHEKAMAEERAERERLQHEHEAKIAAERAENERLRMAQEAKERAEKQRIEAEQRAKEAAEKAASEAPDREKLRALADVYAAIPKPVFENDIWDSKYRVAMDYVSKGIKYMREQ